MVQIAEFVPSNFLSALKPEACAKTKLAKGIWLNVFRHSLKNLDAVLNRMEKEEISVLTE